MKLFCNLRESTRSLLTIGLAATLCVICSTSTFAQNNQQNDQPNQAQPSESDRAKGEALIQEAQEHLEARRWQQAADTFRQALQYLPDKQQAQQGLSDAMSMLQEGTIVEDVQGIWELQREKLQVELTNLIQQAEQALAEGAFDQASQAATTAQLRLSRGQRYLSPSEFENLNQRIQELIDDIGEARYQYQLQQQQIEQQQAKQARREEEAREQAERQRLINENLRRVRQLQKSMKYDEALQVIDETLFIDELNPAALALRDIITQTKMMQDYAEIQRRKESGYAQLNVDNQEAMIPPRTNISGEGMRSLSGVYSYPEDWKQITLRRLGGAFQDSAANRRVSRKLSDSTVMVDFSGNTFEQAIDYIEQVADVPVYVDWKALEFIGVDRDDKISLHLKEVPAETALERVLQQLGDPGAPGDRPKFAIQDGTVTISSEDQLRKQTVTQVYDIRDLLFEVPMFEDAPNLDLDAALSQGRGAALRNTYSGSGFRGAPAAGASNNSGGVSGFGDGAIFGEQPAEQQSERPARNELVQQIIDLLQETVDPEGWRDLGGDTGTIQELNGNLIITNTPANQSAIEGLLSQLREIRALQINVESRFLAVSTNWFEKIGVDLDLFFDTNSDVRDQQLAVDPLAHLSDLFGADGQLQDPFFFGPQFEFDPENQVFNQVGDNPPFGSLFGTPDGTFDGGVPNIEDIQFNSGPVGAPIRATDGFAPIGLVQDHFSLVDQLADLDSTFANIASNNPAVSLGVQFLDDVQVDLLIEATQADRRSVVLTAPRLTFFNGQRAWVAVATQVGFVSSLVPIIGDASGAFLPIPDVIQEGFVLDVEGVISADRRYVTMTVISQLAENVQFRTFEVQGAAGGGGTVGGEAAQFSSSFELPEVSVSIVQTTVSVPDKGTILLGGQRKVTEVEVETGVPVLSKVPWINRFFTNRVTSKEEQTLLILIRPEIIIQQENEDLLFPGLSDQVGSGAAYLR